ncbi:MAG: hypothetical protein JW839_04540 [Candidatus Lokiarchaeota archaeon]|nr:hypothetical protein [Candidatus Lokiarchaeota archaeon]
MERDEKALILVRLHRKDPLADSLDLRATGRVGVVLYYLEGEPSKIYAVARKEAGYLLKYMNFGGLDGVKSKITVQRIGNLRTRFLFENKQRVACTKNLRPRLLEHVKLAIGWREHAFFYLLTFGRLTTTDFYDYMKYRLCILNMKGRKVFFKHIKPIFKALLKAGHLQVTERAWCAQRGAAFTITITRQGGKYRCTWMDKDGKEVGTNDLDDVEEVVDPKGGRACTDPDGAAQQIEANVVEHAYSLTSPGEAFCFGQLENMNSNGPIKEYLKAVYESCHQEVEKQFFDHMANYYKMEALFL